MISFINPVFNFSFMLSLILSKYDLKDSPLTRRSTTDAGLERMIQYRSTQQSRRKQSRVYTERFLS